MRSRSARAGRQCASRRCIPRFNDRYYSSFVEDDNGIRFEFMHNPPREAVED